MLLAILMDAAKRTPNGKFWYVAPTYRQAKDIAWKDLKDIYGAYFVETNESELSVQLRNGAIIALKGAKQYDRLRGPGLNGLVIDEYADMDPRAWEEVLRPMVAVSRGFVVFAGTPKGKNHFFKLLKAARTKPNWEAFHFRTIDGGYVSKEEIEDSRRDLDERTFRQEYLATFETYAGIAYFCFSDARNVRDGLYNPNLPLIWSLDFNVSPMASIIAQRIPMPNGRDQIQVLDEIFVTGSTNTYTHCEVFAEKLAKYRRPNRSIEVHVYGDASANSQKTSAEKTDYDIIRDWFRLQQDLRPVFRVPRGNPSVRGRVAAVNGMLFSDTGETRLWLDPKCKYLQTDLEQVVWKQDRIRNTIPELDQQKDKDRTHISDALGYLIHYEFSIDKPKAQVLTASPF